MDKWVRQSTSTKSTHHQRKTKRVSHSSLNTRRDKDMDKDLQRAIDESRLEAQQQDDRYIKDIEQATRLSLQDKSHLHQTTLNVTPFGAKPSTANRRGLDRSGSGNDDTWAVDSFLDSVLNQASSPPSKDYTLSDSPYRSNALSPQLNSEPNDADSAATGHEGADDEWEVHYDSETDELYEVPCSGHNDEAEESFFGQLRREAWDTDEIRSSHATAKRRSVANVVKKNKRTRTLVSDSGVHDYYNTADDVLDDNVQAAGFGDSVAGLSWEGVGQSRYA
ncbi:hypothetical protein [Absidia glauca]|uniref:Uncharacterized protein n=1 Tax=Absidia glauca TaxID=4829 RepID=A0A168MKB9_ABSGL|nr:hypothetical protein [Absidia glauca]